MKKENYNKYKDIFKFIINVLSWVVLIILLMVAAFLLFYLASTKYYESKGKDYKAPISMYTIISPSMEPNLKVYDIIVDKKVNKPEEIQIGDVITFVSRSSFTSGMIITHRVVGIVYTNDGLEYTTKGDNNNSNDSATVPYENVLGKVYMRIPQLGRVQSLLSTGQGWLIFVIVPVALIIIADVVKLVRLSKANKKVTKTLTQEEEHLKEIEDKKLEIQESLKEKYQDKLSEVPKNDNAVEKEVIPKEESLPKYEGKSFAEFHIGAKDNELPKKQEFKTVESNEKKLEDFPKETITNDSIKIVENENIAQKSNVETTTESTSVTSEVKPAVVLPKRKVDLDLPKTK